MPRIRILFEKEKQRIMGRKRYINEIEANAMAGTQFKKKKKQLQAMFQQV